MTYEYRISKYNPLYRNKYAYTKCEWTEYSDIGRYFEGNRFTLKEYLIVEKRYIDCISDLLSALKIKQMNVLCYEPISLTERMKSIIAKPSELYSHNYILSFSRKCLRNKLWAKLETPECSIHFGYDYYLYVRCNITYDVMTQIVGRHNLFCEVMESPYK